MDLKKPTLNDNLILLTGYRSSGKSLVSPFLLNCNNVIGLLKDPTASAISDIYRKGLISFETSSFLLKLNIDNARYCSQIGRNLNTRLDDETSIWNGYDIMSQVKKLVSPRGEIANKEIRSDKKFYIFDTHNGIPTIPLLSNCYSNLMCVNVVRSPISVIYSWCRDGLFASERLKSALSQQVCTLKKDKYIPIIFDQISEDFHKLSHFQRCLKAYLYLKEEELNHREKNAKYENLIFEVSYEKFLLQPIECVRDLLSFVGASIEPQKLQSLFEREKVPRHISTREIDDKYLTLKNLAKSAEIKILDELYINSIEYL